MLAFDTDIGTAEGLRIAAIAIAGYDYLITLPAEWRFYKGQRNGHISISCAQFIAIRYISVALIVVSNWTWFDKKSPEECRRWYLVAPILKALQVIVSQLVLSVRTYNLSKRSRRVGWFLFIFYWIACAGEWFTILYRRSPQVNSDGFQCHALGVAPGYGVWIHYLINIFYIFVVTIISFRYLGKYYFSAKASMVWDIIEIMFYDGLGYFLLLTGTNIFNIVLYMTESSTQSAGASLGFVLTWIMTQRLLIDLNDAGIARRKRDSVVTVSQTIESAQDVSRAIRSFDSQKEDGWVGPDLDATNTAERGEQVDVHVRIEKTVRIDENANADMFRARRPGSSWVSQGTTWSTATHDSRESIARPPRDPMMATMRP